jgi:hypothetical protein
MEILEPKYFIRICVERELTDAEFEDMTEIIDDEIGDIVSSDDVLEHLNKDGMWCYVFQLRTDIEHSEQGAISGDIISYEIDRMIPPGLQWEMEASTDDIEIDVPDDATEEQVQEAALNYFRNILNG